MKLGPEEVGDRPPLAIDDRDKYGLAMDHDNDKDGEDKEDEEGDKDQPDHDDKENTDNEHNDRINQTAANRGRVFILEKRMRGALVRIIIKVIRGRIF